MAAKFGGEWWSLDNTKLMDCLEDNNNFDRHKKPV